MTTTWSASPDPTTDDRDAGQTLNHFVCCDDADLALCNIDVTTASWQETRPADCVVCVDMDHTKSCPRHGRCTITRRWRTWLGRERGR